MHPIAHRIILPTPDHDGSNLKGWENVANRWKNVSWPRRPVWKGEFSGLEPLLSSMTGKEALIIGATPEFRSWLHAAGARVSLYEKSRISLAAMTSILQWQFLVRPQGEIVIPHDWESPSYERNRYSLVMGDSVSGYLETTERLTEFLVKLNRMMQADGHLILREFVNMPFRGTIRPGSSPDLRRWCYILMPNIAIEGNVFYEDKLAMNLAKMGDKDVLATCANPPRVRLMLSYHEFCSVFRIAGFRESALSPPVYINVPKPALWVLEKTKEA